MSHLTADVGCASHRQPLSTYSLIRQMFQGTGVLHVGVSVELWRVHFLPSQGCLTRVEDSLDSDNDTLKVKLPRPESC